MSLKDLKLIILDRDETLNHDPGYLKDIAMVKLKPLVVEGLTLLKNFGYKFVVATNQSGIGRGLITKQQVKAVNAKIAELLAQHHIHIEGWFICPHTDSDGCNCRKPADGLIRAILKKFRVAAQNCYIIGDRMRDIMAGAKLGIVGILVPGETINHDPPAENLIFQANSLLQAAEFILQRDFELNLQKKIFTSYTTTEFQNWLKENCFKKRKKIVFTNGCFDILHVGHVQYLSQASQLGDILVVGLNSDSSVRQLKGPKRPINTFADRALLLASYPFISAIVQFSEETPHKIISLIKPAVHVKGGDYIAEKLPEYEIVTQNGGKVIILPFRRGYSTSNLVKKISQAKA